MNSTHIYLTQADDRPAIVCDTNIWYTKKSDALKDDFKLVVTWLSIYELFKASDKRMGVYINTWDRMIHNSSYIDHTPPEQQFQYYVCGMEIDPINSEAHKQQKLAVETYTSLMYLAKQGLVSEERWGEILSNNMALRNLYKEQFLKWADVIFTFRKEHPNRTKSLNHLTTFEGFKFYFEHCTKPLLFQLLEEDMLPQDYDFSNLELFSMVFNQYLIDLELEQDHPVVNDLIDVCNMMYVTPVDKYWTEETKWIEKIKRAGMQEYLFIP